MNALDSDFLRKTAVGIKLPLTIHKKMHEIENSRLHVGSWGLLLEMRRARGANEKTPGEVCPSPTRLRMAVSGAEIRA